MVSKSLKTGIKIKIKSIKPAYSYKNLLMIHNNKKM